ncbi:MAG TPA: response regulator transcription factor [Tissierellia bacterium]|nr:response regulator transcription factor [Tissierellia bacterium]
MFKIAICDDENVICQQLNNILMDIGVKTGEEFIIHEFNSGEDLYNFLLTGNRCELIFLDIELREINGVEVGKKIREELDDETTQIVYISGKESYAMELFAVRPLNFLIKPLKAEKIEQVLKTARKIMHCSNPFFEYRIGNVNFNVLLKDVLYFESRGRKVRIITRDDEIEYYGKLSEVEEKLKNEDFFFIHKSFLINYNHVIEYGYDYVKMSNKEQLSISQNNRKAVREKLLKRRQRKSYVK